MSTSHPFPRTRRSPLAPLGCAAALSIAASCGGSPPAATPPAPSDSAAVSPPPSASPPASAAPASSPPASSSATSPTAHVIGVAVAQKADHYTRVTITFENPTDKTCKISGYKLSWDQGSKDIPLDNFSLAPGKSETRAMRVHAGEGDISRLVTADGTKVELHADCAAH